MSVIFNKKTSKSGKALQEALENAGYDGRPINWGNSKSWCSRLEDDIINTIDSVASATNKHKALQIMDVSKVPTAYIGSEVIEDDLPVVGRPDYHSQGRWLRYIETLEQMYKDIRVNKRHPTTHYQKFISDAREFRVHIVFGHSIKISEKITPDFNARVKNHRFGAKCVYPENFTHKKTLRRIAREAVESLCLDFGAVDILYKDDKFYVLEVNSAPCLTDANSDTLERYVNAFITED